MNKFNERKKSKGRLWWLSATIMVLILTSFITFSYYSNKSTLNNESAKASINNPESRDQSNTGALLGSNSGNSSVKPITGLTSKEKAKELIGSVKEFHLSKMVAIKGKVLDYYEVPSNSAFKKRITVIDAENMKYSKLRIEESYKIEKDQTEQVFSTHAMVADHVIVKLNPKLSENGLDKLLSSHGMRIRRKMYSPGIYLVETPKADINSVPNAMASLGSENGISISDPDWIVYTSTTPNDASFTDLWGMNNTGQTGGTADADIDAVEAWDLFTGSSSVLVGVIDTGINYNHPDLAANIWTNPGEIAGNGIDDDGNGLIDDIHGYDFVNNDGDPNDDHAHGSHCAGTIGGVGNNGAGVAGVNWQVTMMGLKFLSASGSGNISDAVDCVNYATDNGVHLTSNSWGGGGYSATMEEALINANANNILFVAAAGNSSSNNDNGSYFPSGYEIENVISVAATDHNDNLASFSSYGATTVDLGAPGVNVYSTVLGSGYDSFSGTSMATPHVAGACALLKGFNSELTAAQIKFIIMNSGDQINSLAGITLTGRRLNALNALNMNGDSILIMNKPVDGKSYLPGMEVPVQWVSLNVDGNIKIELIQSGSVLETLADSTENDGSFTWTIPADTPLGDYQIQISSIDTPTLNGSSNISIVTENFPLSLDGWAQSAGSNASWSIADDAASHGALSLKSDSITDNETAAIEYFGNFEAGQVSFDKKVSSEGNYDYLVFYIDGVEQARWSGDVNWSNETFAVSAGVHTFKWEYEKDGSVSSGSDSAWIDEVTFPAINSNPLLTINRPIENANFIPGMSVDILWSSFNISGTLKIELLQSGSVIETIAGSTENDGSLNWTVPAGLTLGDYQIQISSNDQPTLSDQVSISVASENFPKSLEGWTQSPGTEASWSVASDEASQGALSLKSDDINDYETAAIEFTGTFKAGTISFDKKVSSEGSWDYLIFYIDGIEQARWSGDMDWSRESYPVTAGTHTFKWTYEKDGSVSSLEDCAWIDEVSMPSQNNAPEVTTAANAAPSAIQLYDTTELSVEAIDSDGDALTYNWSKLSGPGNITFENSTMAATNATFSEVGTYEIQVTISDSLLETVSSTTVTVSELKVISEKGSFNIVQADRNTWNSVTLSQNYENPVVIFSPLTTNGGQPAHIRVKNVLGNSFEWQIEEWDYLDGYHIAEKVDYIVLEAGTYTLPDGRKFVAGNVVAQDSYTSHSLGSSFQSIPVVVTQLASAQDSTPGTVRLNNIQLNSFDVKLQSEETKGKVHGDEIVSYIAVETGAYSDAGLLEAGATGIEVNHNWFNIQFTGTYTETPSFFASFQTTRGGDTADLRIQSLTNSEVDVKVHEEQSKDSETKHTNEKLGYILFNLN